MHATYLITGIRKELEPPTTNGRHEQDGEDEVMQSSPFMSSSMSNQESKDDQFQINSISLVREEDLESTSHLYRAQYAYGLEQAS